MRGSSSSTLLALSLGVACAGPPPSHGVGGLRVALLKPGRISDQMWNGEAYRGPLVIRDSPGASSHIQTRTSAAFDGIAPGIVFGGAVIDLPQAFLTVSRAVRDRTLLPPVFTLGAESGVVRFLANPAPIGRISRHAHQILDCVQTSLSSGARRAPVSWRTSPTAP